MYLHYTPLVIQKLLPRYTWRRESSVENKIYLTFDDGPVPEITPYVLQELRRFGAKATFFCVGENISKYPEIFRQILSEGHRIGNHTHSHLNAQKTGIDDYLANVRRCDEELKGIPGNQPRLFRPPYGRITKKVADILLSDWEIIMWDVLSADFDQELKPEVCLQKSIKYTKSGSIIVFHDNIKAYGNLSWVLPRYLDHFTSRGYFFEVL